MRSPIVRMIIVVWLIACAIVVEGQVGMWICILLAAGVMAYGGGSRIKRPVDAGRVEIESSAPRGTAGDPRFRPVDAAKA